MLSHSTILGDVTHFHPPLRVLTALESPARKFAARLVPPKRMHCKTCLGKGCTGHCRFRD